MVRKGMRIANISRVVVLFPNLFPLLSVAMVMKGLGQSNWNPRMVLPSMSEPKMPQPMSEVQIPLSGKPAASDQKLRHPMGGSFFSCGIGNHCSLLDKKFLQTLRSSLMRGVT